MHSPILLAFGFGAPALLWGLGAASAPLIIHLLSRRRYRAMHWAAMQWLLAALKKHTRRIRLEQIILLTVRTLLLVCIVLAMSRPYLQGAGTVLLPGSRTHRILVIDCSYSMGYRLAERSRFERAKQVAAAILADSRPGDAASLIAMASPPRVMVGEPSANLAAVSAEIEHLPLLHGGADLATTLSKLKQVLAASNLDRREIYFITDLQQGTWGKPAGTAAVPLQQLAAEIAQQAAITVVDLGRDKSANTAVVGFQLQQPFVTVNRTTRFLAAVRNFGPADRSDLELTLAVDGQPQQHRSMDLPAGQQADLVLSTSFPTPGPHLVRVQISDDPLAVDNARWLALEVKEYVDLLLVDGEPSGRPFDSETDYLRVALAPEPGESEPYTVFHPEVVHEADALDTDWGRFDCVLFANVAQFTEDEYRLLDTYLRRGGSVVWFLGDQVQPDSYNRLLYRDGKGPFPVRLAGPVGNARDGRRSFRFDPLQYAHPIVKPFQGAQGGGLLTTPVLQYFRAERPADGNARVALAFETGDPAIITATVHRGRVAVVTTSADLEWTTWPLHYSYVPVMNELLNYVIADPNRYRNLTVGQTYIHVVPPTATGLPVTVRLPDGTTELQRLAARESLGYFRFQRTYWSGGYRLSLGPPLAVETVFAANLDTRESDLTRTHADELAELVPSWKVRYVAGWQAEAAGQSSVRPSRGQVHRPLLYAALLLLFFESLLAWRFGHYEPA